MVMEFLIWLENIVRLSDPSLGASSWALQL
jgi:hypothetical protein